MCFVCLVCLVCVLSVCVCVCVLSVCVCVCVCLVCVLSVCVLSVCVCVSLRCTNHANTIRVSHTSQKSPCLSQKSTPNTISLSYSTTALFHPTNPHMTKITFDFPLRNSEFYFLFSVALHWFLFSVCPLMKPPQNLSKITLPQIWKSKQL